MAPGAKNVRELLYVSDVATNSVYVYNYRTQTLVGTLTGFLLPEGACVNARGDVWIVEEGSAVEYAHGGSSAIKTLTTNGYGAGCAVSPDGDLAVANTRPLSGSGSGDIQLWHHDGSGPGATYYNRECGRPRPPGYDKSGNLYVASPAFYVRHSEVCLLAVGAPKLKRIHFNSELDNPQSAQWDGTHLTLADAHFSGKGTTSIYRVKELASGDLRLLGTTVLSDPCGQNNVGQPFIVAAKNTPVNHERGTAVVGVNSACNHPIDYWPYPVGGDPTSSITDGPSNPQGVAVSIAP